jgi:lipid II:glycine glycyltransferase (peptidoglycan interpeptide bridge formation enzyme)
MIDFRPATAADEAAWQAHLARTASGDFLHDWGWAEVAALDGQPQRRYMAFEGGELVAIAAAQVRRLALGRTFWYVPHGPVLDFRDPRAAGWLRAMAIGLRLAARRERAIAVKLEPRLERGAQEAAPFARFHHDPRTLQVGQTRLVTLDDDDALLAGFDKDTRYAVRRAAREGVEVRTVEHATDAAPAAIDRLHALVLETQQRAGFPRPSLERYRAAWRALGGAGRALIFEATLADELLASGMLVVEGERSYYLFAGSRRERPGEPKRYASYRLQWEMMRHARSVGCQVHDLWGIAPEGSGPEHPWHGVGLFKKGFGGRALTWAGTWDLVVDPTLYRMRGVADRARTAVTGARRRLRRGS